MGSKIEDNEVIKALKIINQYCINRLKNFKCNNDCLLDKIDACNSGKAPEAWNMEELPNGK